MKFFLLIIFVLFLSVKSNQLNIHDLTNIPINDHEVNNTETTTLNNFINQTTSHYDLTNHVVNISTTSPKSQASKCELITLPMCKGIGYNQTKMPNQFNHDTQEEAGLEVHQFWPLVEISCSDELRLFLCLIYAPICMEDFNEFIPPCRSTCERAKKGCEPVMSTYNFPWPKSMNCDNFPIHSSENLCIDKKAILNNSPKKEKDLDNSIFNLGNIPIFEEDQVDDKDSTNNYDVFSNVDQNENKKKKNKRIKNRKNKKEKNFLFDLTKTNEDSISSNCKCECRRPFISIKEVLDKNYFNQITTGGQINCAFPCNSPYFSRNEQKVAIFWITLFSFVCLFCTLITLLTFISDTERFRYPERCIIFLSSCYLMVSAGFLLRLYLGHENIACDNIKYFNNDLTMDKRISHDQKSIMTDTISNAFLSLIRYENTGQIPGSCLVIFWLLYYFGMCASVWWVLLTLTWFLAAGLKWSNEAIDSYSQYFHLIAWFTPAIKAIIIVSIGAIDGDSLTGVCYVGNLNDSNLLIFVIIPLCAYLAIGCLFLFAGFISLFRIRDVLRQQTRSKTDKLEKLMVRIVIFSVLYIVPGVIVIMCLLYEYQNRQNWALNHNCHCKQNQNYLTDNLDIKINQFSNEQPLYIVFLIKYIMCLGVGITSGFWIWSSKTLNSWIRFYGKLCCFYCCGSCKPEEKFKNRDNLRQSNNSMAANLMSNIAYNNQQSQGSQLLSSSEHFTINSNKTYKQLLNQQQHQLQLQQQQFGTHLGLAGLKSLSGSNNGSSSTSHCKLPLSHV